MRFIRLFIMLFLAVIFVALASQAARFLVVDDPEKSDAIVVLAGETNVRPARALELLRKGVAGDAVLDVETRDPIYGPQTTGVGQKNVNRPAEATPVFVSPLPGFFTHPQ